MLEWVYESMMSPWDFDKYTLPDREDPNLNPDAFKSFDYLAKENGFLWEKHMVTTEDGYILELWRIPGKKGEAATNDKIPIFL